MIMPAMMPRLRMRRTISSNWGCSSGSPPLIVMMVVPKSFRLVDAAEHLLQRNGLGKIVELVAIGAGEIAAANGNQVRENNVIGTSEAPSNHPPLADAGVPETNCAAQHDAIHLNGAGPNRAENAQSAGALRLIDLPEPGNVPGNFLLRGLRTDTPRPGRIRPPAGLAY